MRVSNATHRQNWEDLGELDPLWAILSEPEGRHGGWDIERFFRTGANEIASALDTARLFVPTLRGGKALDFGCGVGRLTRALAQSFEAAVGVDVSSTMIERARQLNEDVPSCTFECVTTSDLSVFRDRTFTFVYSCRVLQHQPRPQLIAAYVGEFLRLVSDEGVVMFQVPSAIPLWHRVNWRRRAYLLGRALGLSHRRLYAAWGLDPIKMTTISVEDVRTAIAAVGGELIAVLPDDFAGANDVSWTYLARRARAARH